MSVTIADIKALDFGYLTGADLVQWAPWQLLANQYSVDSGSLAKGAKTAYSEVQAALGNRYDVAAELAKTGDARSELCVKVATIAAIRNCLGNAQSISEKMAMDFKWCDKTLMDFRNGQSPLPLALPPVPPSGVPITSTAQLINSSFSTLG